MSEIKMSTGETVQVDPDDYQWLSGKSWHLQRDMRGKVYAATDILGKTEYLHKLVMEHAGKGGEKIDHINGNTLDNRKQNLRPVTTSENAMNNSKTKNNKSSGYKGVTKMPNGRWKAHIGKNDEDIHIGYYGTEEEAARAYDERAKKIFGQNAKLNFNP